MNRLVLWENKGIYPHGEIFLYLEGSNMGPSPTTREIKYAIWDVL